jgi:NNP family nitrate/nitrite transporter-like MFS transporter
MFSFFNNGDIANWQPESADYWRKTGRSIAIKNLFSSVVTLLVAFMVWMYWSAFVIYLGQMRSEFTVSQLYWLTALPLISAGFLRIVYSFTVPIFGGKNWTVFSTSILMLPLIGSYYCLQYQAPFSMFAFMALLTGVGGANFASSSANISFFFPHRLKSIALGINAAIGNLGVGLIQWLVPFVLATTLGQFFDLQSVKLTDELVIQPQIIPLLLLLLVVMSTLLAYFGMNNIKLSGISLKEQSKVFSNKHCWLMSVLYTFTFGTFIGFAAVLPMMFVTVFNHYEFAVAAIIGGTLSSVIRPLSNYIAVYTGAVKLTLLSFIIMLVGLVLMLFSLPTSSTEGSFTLFVSAYMIIFIGTGLGKGSTTSMIPEIFQVMALKKQSTTSGGVKHLQKAATQTATVLGITSAIATFGAFLTPQIFGFSQSIQGDLSLAIWFFIVAKVICLFITWWFYWRKTVSNPLFFVKKNGQAIIIDKPNLHSLI